MLKCFFHMLANISNSDEVDIDTFVEGCMRMKGSATSIDMQSLVYETKLIHHEQRIFYKSCETMLGILLKELALPRNGSMQSMKQLDRTKMSL